MLMMPGDGDSDSSSDEEDEMNPNAQRAGRELCDLLIYLRLAGRITSKVCCVIAWWANKAGDVGPCEALGKITPLSAALRQRSGLLFANS